MSQTIDHLSPQEKRARLAALLKSAPAPADYPVSFGQAALMQVQALAPAAVAYNTMLSAAVKTAVDVTLLRQAFETVVERHWVLRSSFFWRDGEPRQRVNPAGAVAFEVVEASGWAEQNRASRASDHAARPFDLEHGPVCRLALFSHGPADHTLLFAAHHVAVDYWSLVILMGELTTAYDDLRAGRPVSLPALRRQYVDHAVWQHEMLAGPTGQRFHEHWRTVLDGERAQLSLPTDAPRPSQQSYRGDSLGFEIDAGLLERLRALARDHDTTLYAVVFAAFNVLLHRYTGETDLIVGSPMAGRTAGETEEVVGYFANTIVLRTRCDGTARFSDYLTEVARTLITALDAQDYPFPLLVEKLQVVREPGRAPLCDVMFSWDKPHRRNGSGTLGLRPLAIRQLGSTHDLALIGFEQPEGLEAVLQYSTDLFEPETIARMSGHLRTLLEQVAADPLQPIGALNLLSGTERHQQLEAWNDTTTPYPRATVHALFAEQARRTPDAIALDFSGDRITYWNLDRSTNRLAHALRARGIARGAVVAICMERSADFVLAVLATIKAGGVFLPIDPADPLDRIEFMIGDARARTVLAHRATADIVAFSGPLLLESALADDMPDEPPPDEARPADPIYVMYTSGSTGRPKGISIPHSAVVRLVRDTNYVSLTPHDRVAQASNVSFDAATFEIWGALLNGAILVGVPRPVVLAPQDLAAAIRHHGITVMFVTTAVLHQMALEVPDGFAPLRCLLFGGETCDPNLVRVLLPAAPEALLHVYGPTETTTFATWHHVTAVPDGATSIPIGMPLANTTLYVLDAARQPVPAGVTGEIYLGGDGMALAYVRRPELTAERFVPHPFRPGERLYRTGDLARRSRHDGSVTFLGRIDHQVKIRGFRIEPGEIEAALRGFAGVDDAAVVVPGTGLDKRLVAYVAVERVQRPTPGQLRAFLQTRLPEYMVPAAFVVVARLPLTTNGKVDRQALLASAAREALAEESFAPARSESEQRLVALWAAALRVETIGVHTDFFAAGGHSLLATRLTSAIRREFEVELPLMALFEAPTIAELATTIDGLRAAADQRLRAELQAALEGLSDAEIEAEMARLDGRRDES